MLNVLYINHDHDCEFCLFIADAIKVLNIKNEKQKTGLFVFSLKVFFLLMLNVFNCLC